MTLAIAIILSATFGCCLGIVGAGLLASAKHADRPLYDTCPGCGATMIPGLPIEHELGCRYGLRVEWVTRDRLCGCTSRDCHTGQIVHERGCRFDNTLTRIN